MVSTASMVMMVVSMLFAIALPVGLAIYGKKKLGCSLRLFLLGCIVFFCFAVVLEGLVHSLVFATTPGIQDNIWIFAIYGGFMAGLFEETGRLFGYKFFCKNRMSHDEDALMYGFGHGGFEVFYLLVPGMISNLVMANMINSGTTSLLLNGQNEQGIQAVNEAIDALISTSPILYTAGMVERISAVGIHIALSVIVWFAVKNAKYYYYILAIGLHMLVDTFTVLIARVCNAAVVEIILLVVSAGLLYIAYLIWKKEHIDDKAETV